MVGAALLFRAVMDVLLRQKKSPDLNRFGDDDGLWCFGLAGLQRARAGQLPVLQEHHAGHEGDRGGRQLRAALHHAAEGVQGVRQSELQGDISEHQGGRGGQRQRKKSLHAPQCRRVPACMVSPG